MKLHELLARTLADYDRLQDSPDVEFDMGQWHTILSNGKCIMCLGGVYLHTHGHEKLNTAVVRLCDTLTDEEIIPLLCLDGLRMGRISNAIQIWYNEPCEDISILTYNHANDPIGWRDDMDQVLARLRELDK